MLIPISLSYCVLLPFISLSFSLLSWTTMRLSAVRGLRRTIFSRIDKRKIRNHGFQPCKPECFLPASTANRPLGVAKSHAVKIKKKDRNRAISAIYSDVAAAKSHKWKKERKKKRPGATSRCLGPLRLHTAFSCKPCAAKPCTAESRTMKAASGHFIWNTLSVLRGRGTAAVLLPFISLSFSLLSWTRLKVA